MAAGASRRMGCCKLTLPLNGVPLVAHALAAARAVLEPVVVVLGPERGECQAEVSLTDAVALGCKPPVRLSGEIEGTPGITLRHGNRELRLERGLIVAKRHIHMTPVDAGQFGVRNGQSVRLKALTARPLTFGEVEVRVSEKFSTVVHLDYDEANACGFQKGDRGLILS